MKHTTEVHWHGKMAFEAEVNGHKLLMDADESVGGENLGPRPKPLMLVAAGGCSGMDVVSILEKMKVIPDDFRMEIGGELTEEHPKVYRSVHIIYHFTGKDLPYEKLEKAVKLSQEKYCGVSAMLGKASALTWEIKVHE